MVVVCLGVFVFSRHILFAEPTCYGDFVVSSADPAFSPSFSVENALTDDGCDSTVSACAARPPNLENSRPF